jgi:hypothetical protein
MQKMANMTTLGKVSTRVDELSKNCTDRLVPVKDISFDGLESVEISNKVHPMRPIAQQSIANRLGIPIQYLRKCPPEVQAYNMNHWIKEEKNKQLFARFDGDEVRAIFTPRYQPIDTDDPASLLQALVAQEEGMLVLGSREFLKKLPHLDELLSVTKMSLLLLADAPEDRIQ